MGARLGMAAEPEDTDDQPAPEPGERPVVRKRAGRDPFRDLVIPVAAITAVVVSIVLVQLIRGRESTPSAGPVFAPGSYSPIELGSSGGGKPTLGERAPGFQLLDVDGAVIRLEDFRGRPVLVNFWATWCGPCKSAMRALDDLATRSAGRVRVVGLSVDDEPDAIAEFARSLQLRFPIAWDRGLVTANRYRPATMPSTFVIDARGVVRHELHGWHEGDVAILEGVISDLAH